MSIMVIKHEDGGMNIYLAPGKVHFMKQILARACNVWPDAPVEIKEFHDLVVHGELLQNYRAQPKFTRREELAPSENEKLDTWASENKEAGN